MVGRGGWRKKRGTKVMVKHDDWRSVFSRSGRRNFKDLHEGQKHSLGPLIITTGVPLSGARPLLVQNCAAGVPRGAPFNLLVHLLVPSYTRRSTHKISSPLCLSSSCPDLCPFTNIFVAEERQVQLRWEQAVAIIESQRCSLIPRESNGRVN